MSEQAPTALEVVQRFYDAIASRDLEGGLACFSEDAVWILPGRSPIAGEHHGREAIGANVLSQVGPRSDETFRADLLDVAVGERYIVAIQHATAEREGKRLDITACQLLTIENGQIVELRGHYSNQYALDDFWD
jgi:ketosteroid isomerase-like protein